MEFRNRLSTFKDYAGQRKLHLAKRGFYYNRDSKSVKCSICSIVIDTNDIHHDPSSCSSHVQKVSDSGSHSLLQSHLEFSISENNSSV